MRKYEQLKAHSRSVYRSRVFPGLRLDSKAFFKNDLAKVLATLQQGIDSAKHQCLVAELAERKSNRD